MTGWMDTAVAKAKDKFDAQRTKDEEFIAEQKLKRELAAGFYSGLVKWMDNASGEFNRRFGSQAISFADHDGHLSVIVAPVAEHRAEAIVSFDPTTFVFQWTEGRQPAGGGKSVKLDLLVAGNNEARLNYREQGQQLTVEQFGQALIDSALA